MENAKKRVKELTSAVDQYWSQLDIDELARQLGELDNKLQDPAIWKDTKTAGEMSKKQSDLRSQLEPWLNLKAQLTETNELLELNDESLLNDLEKQLETAGNGLDYLKKQLRFSGPYDRHDAIIGIYAGAGGTDAQDWAQMLQRMYLRWFGQNGYKAEIITESSGDEAGIKSVTISVSGSLAYGKLKNEHGVHRLVRLSPFNSDNLRQTSFAKVEVMPKIDKPDDLEIDDKDIKVDVYRAGGHGGQSVNTTDSAVRVTHIPTGVSVAIQNERSQLQNKETAMTILRSRLIQLQMEQHLERLADLKGVNQSAEWGNQIRNYVMHPYKLVKDLRTGVETSDADSVLDGRIEEFLEA